MKDVDEGIAVGLDVPVSDDVAIVLDVNVEVILENGVAE